MSQQLEQLVKQLFEARLKKKIARQELRLAGERLGQCYGDGDPCYMIPDDEQCGVCLEKTPIWEASMKAGREAGAALRAVLRHGKKISEAS